MKIYSVAIQTYAVQPGKQYWFEYHCYEGHDSADAKLWYHSHQKATVLKRLENGIGNTQQDRAEDGAPAVYQLQFEDGAIGAAFEDEVLDSPSQFERPAPPKPPVKLQPSNQSRN